MMVGLKRVKVAIIGCGIFGSEVAIELSRSGFDVSIIEGKHEILQGASGNNLNRVHIGFHYPRDLETAKQAFRCYEEFREKYSSCINSNFLNAYLIANEGSLTSPDEFLDFCSLLGAPYEVIRSKELPITIKGADIGIKCEESVYDFSAMRKLILKKFKEHKISLITGNSVSNLSREEGSYTLNLSNGEKFIADIVVNSSYANINKFSVQAGVIANEMQYEYTVIPIIEAKLPHIGLTVMDGPFTSILPRGSSSEFLLYHVDHSVLATEVGFQLNSDWLMPETGPFFKVDKSLYFSRMIELCEQFIPVLGSAKLRGFLEGPRVIQSKKESSDARPSLVKFGNNDTYVSILSGKVDSSIWVAKNIKNHLLSKFS